jgi:hypothetical protein
VTAEELREALRPLFADEDAPSLTEVVERIAALTPSDPLNVDQGLREAVIADPWSFNRGTLRERLEWCQMQHQVAADQGYPTPVKDGPTNARWHQDCADWYAEMVALIPTGPLDVDRLAKALPAAVNFHFLPPRVVDDPIWRKVAERLAAEYDRLAPDVAAGGGPGR